MLLSILYLVVMIRKYINACDQCLIVETHCRLNNTFSCPNNLHSRNNWEKRYSIILIEYNADNDLFYYTILSTFTEVKHVT